MRLGGFRNHVRVLALLSALILATAPAASAHAVLLNSTPGWGARLAAAPRHLSLEYDEDVVPQYARVSVIAPGGRAIAGTARVAGKMVFMRLGEGGAGSYTVRWRMVASDDGHVTQGAFSFGVRAKPLPPAPVSGVSVAVAPELLEWLQFLGVVLAGGMLAFRAVVLAPVARGLADVRRDGAGVALGVAAGGAAVALHAGLFGFLVGAYPIVGGGVLNVINTQIIPIRVGTHLGQAWTLTTFAWLGVLVLLVAAWVTPQRRERLLAVAGFASLAIGFGISWASHPAARGVLPLVADYVHLLAGALWAGGVLALALLARAARGASGSTRDALFRACFVRFSAFAAPTVLVLALAGLYIALRELPGASAILHTRYGITLAIKTIVFGSLLAVAGYHRQILMPRLQAGVALATVRRTLAFEAALLLVALALAAVLSQTAPPR